jgi:hypothetical protein
MKYYIDSSAWEQILEFLGQIKGIHTEDEIALRRFVELTFRANLVCSIHIVINTYFVSSSYFL